MRPPRQVLVVLTRRIGDVLLATPLVRSLRRAWPEAAIDLLVFRGSEGILAGNPDPRRVLTLPERPRLADYRRLLPPLWRRYDLALAALAGDRPHYLALWSGRRRAGMVAADDPGGFWKRRLNGPSAAWAGEGTHALVQYLRLADALGIERRYEVVTPADPRLDPAAALGFDPAARAFAVLHPQPGFPYKAWTRAGWRGLMERLRAAGLEVVVTGGPDPAEGRRLQGLTAGLPCRRLWGRLTLAATAEVLRRAALYVGVDTSVTHLAAACGTPTVALFGPTDPLRWAPWPQGYAAEAPPFAAYGPLQRHGNVILIQGEGRCVPCHEEGCERHVGSRSRCLDDLPLERVWEALQSTRPLRRNTA